LGDQFIDEALELAEARRRKREEHHAATGRHKSSPPVTAERSHRSPQNAAIPIIQKDLSESQAENLSLAQEQKEKPDPSKQERLQEELAWFVRLWGRACHESGKPTLAWRPSDVRYWSGKLIELIQVLRLSDLTDDDLLKRLRLLAGDLRPFSLVMGDSFMDYNRDGLMIESFARFGQKLWRATETQLKAVVRPPKKSVAEFYRDAAQAGKPAE
jgi:hypothetical protein